MFLSNYEALAQLQASDFFRLDIIFRQTAVQLPLLQASDFFRLDIIAGAAIVGMGALQASDFFRLDIIQHSIPVDFLGISRISMRKSGLNHHQLLRF